MEIVRISTAKLHNNTGQVEGLPANPRQWTKAEVDRLARSLTETPELFEARPCLVYPIDKGYIVLGGNMRLAAAKQNEEKEVPCIVFPKETDADKLREIVIKDNGAFGEWDFDSLANDWDDLPLTDWGVPVWYGNADAGDLEKEIDNMTVETINKEGESESGFRSFTFVFPIEEGEKVEKYIKEKGKEELQARIVELCQKVEVK